MPPRWRGGKLVLGPDHRVWYPEGDHIAAINSAGTIVEYALPAAHCSSYYGAVTVGPDGNIWWTETDLSYCTAISTINLSTKVISEYHPAQSYFCSQLGGIAPGGDGRLYTICLGYSSFAGPVLAVTTTGQMTLYRGPKLGVQGRDDIEAPDGNILFEPFSLGRVAYARFNVTTHALDTFTSPYRGQLGTAIARGTTGRIWSTSGADVYSLTYP